ncbi:MAG TPA: glycosyltransferase family 4 protein [Hyphomicrobiaceae bacterium]|jgi:glycosyltransferase involved in cell wall biosynthesis|nr:glycosyltransferase family 4 protein [Hyphomicrobiaceae bacterium]
MGWWARDAGPGALREQAMIEAAFAVPGDLRQRTGGYIYARRVLELLAQFRVAADHLALPDGYPAPSLNELATTARIFAGLPPSKVLLVDGLAYGAMPAAIIARAPCPIVALVHHPLCLETGLSAARQAELKATETAALALARHVIVTSATTARVLREQFAVPAEKLTVAVPGTDPAASLSAYPRPAPAAMRQSPGTGSASSAEAAGGFAGSAASARLELLAVGSVVPRKGYDLLVQALAGFKHLEWRLTIAGDRDRSPDTTAAIEAIIKGCCVSDRVRLIGAVNESVLAALYTRTDLFVAASLYEGYGMVLSEALAHGLPIITTTGGAAAETVPDACAIKVPPGDVKALAAALQTAMHDAPLRRQLAAAAWSAGQNLPRWEETARIISLVLKEVAP